VDEVAVGDWLGRSGRQVLRSLPPPARDRVRRAYRSLRPAPPPAARSFAFPEDVRDPRALFELLSDHQFGEEGDAYVRDHLERFRVTMAVLPPLPEGAAVLELGSAPYFITRLLRRRGYAVRTSNFSGADAGPEARAPSVLRRRDGTEEVFDFDYFNVETDRFPYADGTFDLVLCCELLEHLPEDPTHMIAESHRVLRKGSGRLVITTPNSARWEKLAAIRDGLNVYERISGYGTHGRHNREYLVWEVRELLAACGFVDLDVFAHDIHDHRADRMALPNVPTQDRECNIFATGTAAGEPRWAYPEWLYISRQGLRRTVLPDLRVGRNHDLQAWGFGELVRDGNAEGLALAPGISGNVLLESPADASGEVLVEGWYEGGGSTATLTCRLGDTTVTRELGPAAGRFTLAFPLPLPPGRLTAELGCDRPGVRVSVVRAAAAVPAHS
jgi:SAM-dependent methyltransferase